jgi:uncharacterized protein with HEPN domain
MPRDRPADPLGDRERLEHMRAAARDALAFAQGRVRTDLDRDRMLLRALVNCVQEIGEAAAQVGEAGRARAPALPWSKMAGMRHILVHAYYRIDVDTVWRVVQEHLPVLVQQLEQVLADWQVPPEANAQGGSTIT